MKEIYVGNLPFDVTEADLRSHFEQFGQIDHLKLITDKFTGRSKGFGFIEFTSKEEAEKAVTASNDKDFKGRKIRVNISKPKTDTGGGGGGRGGRGGFGGGGGNRSGGNRGTGHHSSHRSFEEN